MQHVDCHFQGDDVLDSTSYTVCGLRVLVVEEVVADQRLNAAHKHHDIL